jgi:cytochrome P450
MALADWNALKARASAFLCRVINQLASFTKQWISAKEATKPTEPGGKPEGTPVQSFLDKVAAAEKANKDAPPQARGAAIAQVIATCLRTQPYAMLQELLDQPREAMPFFNPAVGPVVVVRHAHVIKCLERTDLFTVDPYAEEMARANDDKNRNPETSSPFMLGTDKDEWYLPDDVLLRRVVSRKDETSLTAMARQEAEYWTQQAKQKGQGEIDIVLTLARFVPLRIASDYLGVPYYSTHEASCLPGLRGGEPFPLDEELKKVFTFDKIEEGRVPTADDLFNWVKDAFRNIFNNFNRADPLFEQFRQQGIQATEYLTAYIHELIKFYKGQLQQGESVPDTMLTRLLRLQLSLAGDEGATLERELETALGAPLPPGELSRRLSDSLIRSNIFGTVVGGVVNPEEASARIIDSILALQEGKYEVLNGSTYQRALEMAQVPAGSVQEAESLKVLRKYALEGLRLEPQGEVLLRLCVKDNTELDGVLIRQGTTVFVSHAAAMRDPDAIPNPLAFDITRDERLIAYDKDPTRAQEAPQSLLYLQHGYGRHKCLGRYASEITMQESLRAMLRLGHLERRSKLQMDAQNLYAVSLRVGFA